MRKVELATGKVLSKRDLENQVFGEGSTRIGDTLYMVRGDVWDGQPRRQCRQREHTVHMPFR
jgi:glutamine cyclotransferase